MVRDGDPSGDAARSADLHPLRAIVIGGVVSLFAAVLMVNAIWTTELPPPGVARGYTTVFVPPQTAFEVLLLRTDGQAYAALALQPTLSAPEAFVTAEGASYFARRPVLPALFWLTSAGQREVLPVAATVVNALTIGLLAAATAILIQARGRGQDDRLAVLVLLAPAVLLQCRNLGIEALALALAVFGLVLWTRPRPRRGIAALLFVAAVLTRETLLLVPLVVALEALAGRRARFRDLALLLLAPLAYLAWGAFVWSRFGSISTSGNLGPPFLGMHRTLPSWSAADWVVLALLAAVSVAAVVRDHRSTLAHLILAHWVFAVFMTELVWVDWDYFSRILLPVAVFALVLLLPAATDPGPPLPADPEPDSEVGRGPTGSGVGAGGLRSPDERP